MATPIFACGFECGVLTNAGSGHLENDGGPPTFVTSPVRSGLRAGHITPSASVASFRITIASTTRLIGRNYIYFATLPDIDTELVTLGPVGNGPQVRFKQSDSKLYAAVGTTFGATGVAVTTGVWYRLDYDLNINTGGNDLADLQVNGTACGQATASGLSVAQTTVELGNNTTAATFDAYLDDVLLSATPADYPLGNGYIKSYIPNADGTHTITSNDFFGGTSANPKVVDLFGRTDAYTYVDDRPLDGSVTDFDNVSSPQDSSLYLECLFEDSAESVAPRAVEAIAARHQFSATHGDMRVVLCDLNGGTEDVLISQVNQIGSTSLVYHRAHYATIPGGTAWTTTAFNALAFRLSTGGTNDANPDQYLDSIMLEAEYSTPTKVLNEKAGIIENTVKKITSLSGAIAKLIAEKEGIYESVRRSGLAVRQIKNEIVGFYETIRSSLTIRKIVNEIEGIYESTNRLSQLIRKIAEIVKIYEVTRQLKSLTKRIAEIEGIYKTINKSIAFRIIKNEIESVYGSIKLLSSLSRKIIEREGIYEVTKASRIFLHRIGEITGIYESGGSVNILFIGITNEITKIIETINRLFSLHKTINEIGNIYEVNLRIGNLSKRLAEIIGIYESSNIKSSAIGQILIKIKNEIEEIYDTIQKFSSLRMVIAEVVEIYENKFRFLSFLRKIDESESVYENIKRNATLFRIIAEIEGLYAAISRSGLTIRRIISETEQISENIYKQIGGKLTKFISEIIKIYENTKRTGVLYKSIITEVINIYEVMLYPLSIKRFKNEMEGIYEIRSRNIAFIRLKNEIGGIYESIVHNTILRQIVFEIVDIYEFIYKTASSTIHTIIRINNEIEAIYESAKRSGLIIKSILEEIIGIYENNIRSGISQAFIILINEMESIIESYKSFVSPILILTNVILRIIRPVRELFRRSAEINIIINKSTKIFRAK